MSQRILEKLPTIKTILRASAVPTYRPGLQVQKVQSSVCYKKALDWMSRNANVQNQK